MLNAANSPQASSGFGFQKNKDFTAATFHPWKSITRLSRKAAPPHIGVGELVIPLHVEGQHTALELASQ